MSELINAKGLGYTQPVILARNRLELCDEITIVVDEPRALENLKLLGMHVGYLGMHVGYLVDVSGEPEDIYWVHLRKTSLDGKRLRMGPDNSVNDWKEEKGLMEQTSQSSTLRPADLPPKTVPDAKL